MAGEQKGKKERPEGMLIIKGNEEKANESVKNGGIETTFFIESHGNDQQAVADALKNTLLNDFKNEKGVILRKMAFHPVVEKEKLYAGFVECDFVARDPQILMYLALRYGPSAVDISAPDSVNITAGELQEMIADTSASVQVLIGKILDLMNPQDRQKILREKLNIK